MTFDELVKALGPGGVPPLCMFILALVKRWVVLGWQYDLMVEDRNYWRNVAQLGAAAAEKAVTLAEKKSGTG